MSTSTSENRLSMSPPSSSTCQAQHAPVSQYPEALPCQVRVWAHLVLDIADHPDNPLELFHVELDQAAVGRRLLPRPRRRLNLTEALLQ